MEGNKSIIYGDIITGDLRSPDWNDESHISASVDTAQWVSLMKIAPIEGEDIEEVMDFLSRATLNFQTGGKETINALVRGLQRQN
jgi:hypothetical protein